MSTITVILLLCIIGLCIIGMVIGAYFLGFRRGAHFYNETDPTPEKFTPEPIVPDEVMIEVAYLPDASTGPVSIEAPASFGEIVGSADIIDRLTAKLERSERLRKRYLRLLRQERAMMLSYFSRKGLQLSPYWKRWVRARSQMIDQAFAAADWGRPEFANTNRASDSSIHKKGS
jgi:hypothetical protein